MSLYIISLPIGNPKDISQRAIECLLDSDLVIGEEFKQTSKLLKQLGKTQNFELLNEHTREEEIFLLLQKVKTSRLTSLVCDVGTPLLEDPGLKLIQLCIQNQIPIKAIPGANALLTALVLSGMPITPFTFFGFLPQETEKRKLAIQKALSLKHTLVFYETPYRYKKFIYEFEKYLSKDTIVFLGLNLTAEEEFQFHGNFGTLLSIVNQLPKAPPVFIVGNFLK